MLGTRQVSKWEEIKKRDSTVVFISIGRTMSLWASLLYKPPFYIHIIKIIHSSMVGNLGMYREPRLAITARNYSWSLWLSSTLRVGKSHPKRLL